jgi:hypothetical protein
MSAFIEITVISLEIALGTIRFMVSN